MYGLSWTTEANPGTNKNPIPPENLRMTKRFVLSDTSPDPYFTVNVNGAVTLHTYETDSNQTVVEIWQDNKVLCRVLALSLKAAQIGPVPTEGGGHAPAL